MDIIVTTPKSQKATAAQEAEDVKASGGGFYFRCLGRHRPKDLGEGDRIFYVEDGFIRGFAMVTWVTNTPGMVCDTTHRQFPAGWYVFSDAKTWHWIKPIAMRGFQGWRYFEAPKTLEVVGDWLDERPLKHWLEPADGDDQNVFDQLTVLGELLADIRNGYPEIEEMPGWKKAVESGALDGWV